MVYLEVERAVLPGRAEGIGSVLFRKINGGTSRIWASFLQNPMVPVDLPGMMGTDGGKFLSLDRCYAEASKGGRSNLRRLESNPRETSKPDELTKPLDPLLSLHWTNISGEVMDAHVGAPISVYWYLGDTYFALAIPGSAVGRRLSGLVST